MPVELFITMKLVTISNTPGPTAWPPVRPSCRRHGPSSRCPAKAPQSPAREPHIKEIGRLIPRASSSPREEEPPILNWEGAGVHNPVWSRNSRYKSREAPFRTTRSRFEKYLITKTILRQDRDSRFDLRRYGSRWHCLFSPPGPNPRLRLSNVSQNVLFVRADNDGLRPLTQGPPSGALQKLLDSLHKGHT